MIKVLELILGVVFTFMIFSLVTSWIVEYLSMWRQWRGKMLKEYILRVLNDPQTADWGKLVYEHPVIESLHRQIRLPSAALPSGKTRLPVYIPADQIAKALMDIIANQTRTYNPVNPVPATTERLAGFLDALNALPEGKIRTTLLSLARTIDTSAGNDLKEMEKAIACWYEAGMERLAGWYKRDTRPFLFAVGLFVAVLLNVNTIAVVKALDASPPLATAMSDAASDWFRDMQGRSLPTGSDSVRTLIRKIDSLQKSTKVNSLPIGWDRELHFGKDSMVVKDGKKVARPDGRKKGIALTGEFWYESAIGWLMTAFALSFGSPFWFDVLKQFVNMRTAGVKPGPAK